MADVYFFGRAAQKNFSDDRVFAGRDIATYSTPTHAHDHTHTPTHPRTHAPTPIVVYYIRVYIPRTHATVHTHTHMGHTWATHAASIYMYAAIEPSISTSIDRHRFPLWVFSIYTFIRTIRVATRSNTGDFRSHKGRARSHQTTLPIDIDIDIDRHRSISISISMARWRYRSRHTLVDDDRR